MRPAASQPLQTGALVSGAGLVVLVACGLVARNGKVGAAEESVFRAVNDLPGWLYRPLRPFQQFGNVVVAVLVMLAAAAALLRRRPLALAAVLGVVAKLALERAVKALVERRRPGTTTGDIVARGDTSVPTTRWPSWAAVASVW